MAGKRITELNSMTGAQVDPVADVLAIVDEDGQETKKISIDEIALAIGSGAVNVSLNLTNNLLELTDSSNNTVSADLSSLDNSGLTLQDVTANGNTYTFVTNIGGGKAPIIELNNSSQTGTEADELIFSLKAGVSSNQRRYLAFTNFDNTNGGYFGLNALGAFIMYNQLDQYHVLFANNSLSGGNTDLASTGNGAVNINKNLTGENFGNGGLSVYDGVLNSDAFFTAKNNVTSLGYEKSADNNRYLLNVTDYLNYEDNGSFGGINQIIKRLISKKKS